MLQIYIHTIAIHLSNKFHMAGLITIDIGENILNHDRNTPRTRVGSGFCERTLAVKSRGKGRK